MSSTPEAYVPETFPHRWLPAEVELKTWEQIEPWYRKLLDRPIDSPADLEAWLPRRRRAERRPSTRRGSGATSP